MNCTFRVSLMVAALAAGTSAQNDIIAVNWTGSSYSISSATGAGTLLGGTGFTSLNSMAVAYGVVYVATRNGVLISIDPVTGAGTQVAVTSPVLDVRGLATDPTTGVLYAIRDLGIGTPDDLFILDPSTGVATLVGSTGIPGLQGFAIDPSGQAYAWDVGNGSPSTGIGLVTLDLTTAVGTDVNPAVGNTVSIQCLAFNGSGTLYAGRDSLYTCDLVTGVLTVVGGGGYTDLRGIEFTSSASASSYGAGCQGSFGTPTLSPTSLPALGTTFGLGVGSLDPSAGAAFMLVGLDNTTSIFGPLPFPMTVFGLGANCNLWVSGEASVLFVVSGGSGTFGFAVPSAPVFSGFQLFFQAASIDTGAPGGLTVSNGVAATFG